MNKGSIIDTTLRDGEQGVGIAFSLSDKLAIAQSLDNLGVAELEVGIPVAGKREQNDIREIASLGLRARVFTWCRARRDDLQAAAKTRVKGVHLSFPVSTLHLKLWNKDTVWLWTELKEILNQARDRFERVSVGAQDASRAEPDLLDEFVAKAGEYGASRVRVADTVGVWCPNDVADCFQRLHGLCPDMELELHAHNDLGMAVANSLTALQNGASHVSGTVNGIGERCGNAPIEELALGMQIKLKEHIHPLNTHVLKRLSKRVEKASGRRVDKWKPVVGDNIFDCESGIHCAGLSKDRRSYEAYPAESVGAVNGRFRLGRHSGSTGILNLLKENNVEVSREKAAHLRRLFTELSDLKMNERMIFEWLKKQLNIEEPQQLPKSGNRGFQGEKDGISSLQVRKQKW